MSFSNPLLVACLASGTDPVELHAAQSRTLDGYDVSLQEISVHIALFPN